MVTRGALAGLWWRLGPLVITDKLRGAGWSTRRSSSPTASSSSPTCSCPAAPGELWEAYLDELPPDPGYERRRPALQLHKFLNNIRHFGPERYVPRVEAVLESYGW